MLSKLLKYDLKFIYKTLLVFYSLTLIFSLLTRIFFSIPDSTIFHMLGMFCSGLTIGFLVNIIINNLMSCWARFTKNFYGDESYLTHTLPIKRHTLYEAKFLSVIISLFTSFFVIILSLLISYYSKENMLALKNILEIAATTYNSTVLGLLLTVGVVLFLEIMCAVLSGFTGIIIGHQQNNNKMVKSIVVGIVIYFLLQGITVLLLFLIGLGKPEIMSMFTSNQEVNISTLKMILTFGIILYIMINTGLYLLDQKLLKKGVNVE